MTYVKTYLPTLKTHVVNLKRDAKDLSRDLQQLEVRGKLGSKLSLPSRPLRSFASSPSGAPAFFFFFSLSSLPAVLFTEPWEACGGGSQWRAPFYPQGYRHYRRLRQKSNRQIIVATGHHGLTVDTANKKSGKYREGFYFL